jgi:hypothetical protein
VSVAGDNLDKYRPKATVDAMPIGLDADDAAALPGAGRLVFVRDATTEQLDAARAVSGVDVWTDVALFRDGFRRLLNTYVAGMHADYGLSALADPSTFLRTARALADALYGDASVVVDASPSNAAFRSAIDALYPDAAFVDGAELLDVLAARGSSDVTASPRPTPAPPLRAPVFVVGCPRSGTTWLQSMLLAHPGLAGPREETALFSSVKDIVGNDALAQRAGTGVVTGAVRDFAATMFAASLPDGTTRLIEKTPHHALHLDIIESLFPDAFVIAIHRDGRDVVRSLLEVPFGTNDPGRAARAWVESTTAVQRFVPTSLHVRDVEYESLRQDPVAGLTDLLEWAGFGVDDAVRTELEQRSQRRVSEHNQRALALDDAATHAVYRYAGDQLVTLGYVEEAELAAIRRSPRYRLAVATADALRVAKQSAGKLRRLRKK